MHILGLPTDLFNVYPASVKMCIRDRLKIRVEKILEESMVTRILDSVENAAASKPNIDKLDVYKRQQYRCCTFSDIRR